MAGATHNPPSQRRMVCPVSRLPVTTWPQWTGVRIASDYEISISLIGENIILGRVQGKATRENTRLGLELAKTAIETIAGDGKHFIYIEDFSGLTHVAYDARKHYIRFLRALTGIHTLIICADSPLLHLSVKLARRINTGLFDVRVVKSYKEAILFARSTPRIHEGPPTSHLHGGESHTFCPVTGMAVYAPEAWSISDGAGCRVRFRRLGDEILCTEVESWADTGREKIGLLFEARDRIINECFGADAPFIELAGYKGLSEHTTRQIRRAMVVAIMKYRKRLMGYVVYNAPSSVRIAYNVGVRLHKPSFAYSIHGSYDAAIKDAIAISRTRNARPKAPASPPDSREARLKEELLEFLAHINWEDTNCGTALEEKELKHPFKDVYDAISIIKMDIDDIFRDQQRTQVALTESEELSMALLNATPDISMLADLSGIILAANKRAQESLIEQGEGLAGLHLKSCFPPELAPYRMAQFRRCLKQGNPVRFEDDLDGHFFDNTIFPVINADGAIDRVAFYVREITELKQAESHIHALSQELIKAQESERQRIARDLHDNVAQDLASLIIETQTFSDDHQSLSGTAKKRLSHISKILKRSISSIRELVYDLRPPSLDQLGLVRTLTQYFTDFTEGCNVEVDFQSGGLEALTLDFDTEINIYRLIQEALANVRKHSGATQATVRLIASHPMLILRIEDNGSGFDVDRRSADALGEKRMGLKGMEERSLLLRGTFSIHASPGRGTRIMVRIPLPGIIE